MIIGNRVSLSSVVYSILLFIIIIFSFRNFSYKFYPLLNADMAINILMSPDYQLPQDLYAWGQDRGGTLIPLISHYLNILVPISPVSVVSIVHYLILIMGFLATSVMLKTRISKVFLAILWFFPPWHFTDFVLFPFGTQFSLFMTGVWLVRQSENKAGFFQKHLFLALSCFMMILSIWVSELGILMVVLLIVFGIYSAIFNKSEFRSTLRLNQILHILFWVIIAIVFILYAKSTATRIDVYSDKPFNTYTEIAGSLKIIFLSLYNVFIFSSENTIESIYAWMLLAGIMIIKGMAIFGNKEWFQKTNKKWFLFFLINGILTLIVIIISHWVFLNGVGRRYFVLVYISFALVVLFLAETFEKRKLRTLQVLSAVIILTGAISSCYKFYYPRHIPSRIKVLSEFQSLGNIGLIAEYWNSYLSATPDPIRIKATPHDKDYVRNYKLVEEVLAQPRIYVIKDMWMDTFPDTLYQFGRILVRKGDSFYIGQCWVNQYEIVSH